MKNQQNNCSNYLVLLSEAVQVVSHTVGFWKQQAQSANRGSGRCKQTKDYIQIPVRQNQDF